MNVQPPIVSDFTPSIATVQQTSYNGILVHYLNDKNCEICKLEWVFSSGTVHQSKNLQANFAANLLLEGTQNLNSKAFAQKLDEYGAYFGVEVGKDHTNFTLHVLAENLEKALEIIFPIFTHPALKQEEFNNYLLESKQEYEHNLHNSGFVARQELRKKLYSGHPYGQLASINSFDEITLTDVKQYASNYLVNKKFELFVSGKADETVLKSIQTKIEGLNFSVIPVSEKQQNCLSKIGLSEIKHATAKQDAVRIGINIPNQSHPDFLTLNLVNTILGGYFGARLMQNIREEKGWTYGINSSIVPGKELCSLFISTDVLQGKGRDTVAEIKKEIALLQEKELSKEELNQVCAYIKGTLLRSFDGVFEQMDRFQSAYLFGLSTDHYLDYMDLLNNISPNAITKACKNLLNIDGFSEVIVKG